MTVLGFHTAPPGRESLGRTFPQGFTLGYFRLFPPGRTVLNASLFLHLELLLDKSVCWLGGRIRVYWRFGDPVSVCPICTKNRSGAVKH
jgi:hypothetical protein